MKTLYSPQSQRLCIWLKQQRRAKGLTMRDVAKIIDKPHTFIAKVEEGQRRLDVVEYLWYCDKLQLDPHQGLDFIQNP
ncbi:helix-turn-helix transcriptional regulator [Thiomicrospira microaerophila]|uniref:helix-turn-helix domain-containing protein n=1 Tax=Thiomicrospira microaerophila TaxID=406020 RepID=UPI002010BFD8|nr:helix-turn-helix transcriptional regulator [Thiomicrospira microaerophila]UQB41844.1 helix-turn-helix transcriptional regulator [Thiomicrospira microaerophila]